jgi:hypothetical protein
LYVSRRVLAHMNPLAADDVSNIETAFRKWANQLRAVEAQILRHPPCAPATPGCPFVAYALAAEY